jgi:hypothetical protein
VAYIRTVTTASNAIAVQIVHSSRKGSREIEHIWSAHTAEDVEVLKAVARQRLHATRTASISVTAGPRVRRCRSCRPAASICGMRCARRIGCWGSTPVCDHDEVFQALVLARLIEPTSKLATIRVLEEIGVTAPSYPTINRRLPVYASEQWRRRLAGASAAHVGLGPATLVIYDVTTLYFEIDQGDGFREPGFSKERRLEPQITVGLLTDVRGSRSRCTRSRGTRPRPRPSCPSSKLSPLPISCRR